VRKGRDRVKSLQANAIDVEDRGASGYQKWQVAGTSRPPVHIPSPSYPSLITVVGIAGSVKFIGIALA
jgi:hypothetical protein